MVACRIRRGSYCFYSETATKPPRNENMIERQTELQRRYHRKKKMRTLKKKLVVATGEVRDKLMYKIKKLSPLWTEASLNPSTTPAKPKAEKKDRPAPKPKAAPRGRGEKPSGDKK